MADDRSAERDLDRFWNDLVVGVQPADYGRLDSADAEAIRRFRDQAAAPQPPSSRDRVRARIDAEIDRQEHGPRANGRVRAAVGPDWVPASRAPRTTAPAAPLPELGHRRHPVRAAVAVAAVLAVAFVVLGFRSDWWSGSENRRTIPAAVAPTAPVPTAPATPAAGPAEFLWQSRGAPDDPMGIPGLIAVAPDGTIWVPDVTSNRFWIFSPDGTLLDVWGGPGTGEGQFDFGTNPFYGYGAGSIAFDAAGNIYVVDNGNHRIQKFGPDRRFLTAWGSEGSGDGQFIFPSDIAVDAQGRVFVLDGGRYAFGAPDATFVQVFDGDGHFLFDWGTGTEGQEPDRLFGSWGIGIDPDGTILLVDGERRRIQRFTADGVYLETWDGLGTDDGGFRHPHPTDVAVDEQGRLYVTDWNNNRVTVLDREGRSLASWGERGPGDGRLYRPYGLALDGQGNVYVTDDDGRLQAFSILALPEPEATPAS